ncbi:DUF4359 domain-containing protein [Neobacillus sp. K501]
MRIFLSATLIFLVLAFATNPSKDEYVSFVKEEITSEGHPIIGMLSGPVINTFTIKKNYGLFTFYKTKFDDSKDEYVTAIGFLNNFYWVHSPGE